MSLRKTDVGLAWSAGCSLLTPGLDQTVCCTDEENTVGSYLTKLEPSSLQAKARSKIKSPGREKRSRPCVQSEWAPTVSPAAGHQRTRDPRPLLSIRHTAWAPPEMGTGQGVFPFVAVAQCWLLPQQSCSGKANNHGEPCRGTPPAPQGQVPTCLYLSQFWE
ncbi:unnamed protein product [Rangifer tarandus platyrhynchus]|uniref:Uncharacterized protein n=2 Tax=Rangifer tarandus platyrhynchus TaxID=3082113 RepID=A0ACB0ENV3_RANTA|nr:unnamed protein product [Rangifer tarandus platyrhynchus]CAI9702337.1 unnamed protein product [Rangifer tarandus platyrhynchus]